MDDGFMVEQGTVACSSWICRGRTTRLVALGKSRYGDHPASLQIFKFDPATKSLLSTPSVTYNFEDGCDPVSLAVHPEGNYIVCSTTIGGCRLFELNDQGRNFSLSHLPQELRSLEEVGPQKCLVFSTDGSRFATGGVDGHLRIHEWPGMRTIVDESEARNSVNDMDFSLDSKYLASTYTDGSLRIWDTNNGVAVEFKTRPGAPDKFELCRFSRDRTNPYLFCTLQEGYRPATVIWDICTLKIIEVKDLRKHACVMSISADGSCIALGSKDGEVWIQIFDMGACAWKKELHLGCQVTSLSFCPSTNYWVLLSTSDQWGAMITKLDVSLGDVRARFLVKCVVVCLAMNTFYEYSLEYFFGFSRTRKSGSKRAIKMKIVPMLEFSLIYLIILIFIIFKLGSTMHYVR